MTALKSPPRVVSLHTQVREAVVLGFWLWWIRKPSQGCQIIGSYPVYQMSPREWFRLSLLLWMSLAPLRARWGDPGVRVMVGPGDAVSNPGCGPYLLSALAMVRLQHVAFSERILISSGICVVTGFDPWD